MISEVVEARRYHCGQIVRRMRATQRDTIERAGVDPHREVVRLFNISCIRRAWLVDHRLMALGGVTGTLLSEMGFLWLIMSEDARRYPLAIVKEARRQLDEIMETMQEVTTTISLDDADAVRLATFLGFHISDEGEGAPAFSRIERMRLRAAVAENTARRIQIGDARLLMMGYHPCA